MQRLCSVPLLCATMVWSLGCKEGPKGAAPAANIKGVINMDGKPIPTGEVHFSTQGYPPRVLQINNGTFAGEAPVGKNQVEVFIYVEEKAIPGKYGGSGSKRNVAPERYWGAKTTLGATVSEKGTNDFKFDLNSK